MTKAVLETKPEQKRFLIERNSEKKAMSPKLSLLDATSEAVLHVFDLANYETRNGARQIEQALLRYDVQNRIIDIIQKNAALQPGGTYSVSGDAAYTIRKDLLTELEGPVVEQITTSQPYQSLHKDLSSLKALRWKPHSACGSTSAEGC